ncbi:MAG TPA: GntR family transcriptional regulator [Propionibacteriaceae bacterium]|nr:GntR family transcriptional regulator [Propionibacteriaceae bacterium]
MPHKQKLRTVSLVDALSATLRTRVLDGLIDPGVGLSENAVAEEYEVSRPTAQTAIALLVQEGLLRREPHKSARVPVLSRADVEDLFLVRIPLELGVVSLLAGRHAVAAGAREAIEELSAVAPDQPPSVFVAADLGFHRALVDAVGSPRLSRLYAALSGEIHLSMIQSRRALGRDRIVGEHRAILEALDAGDGPGAERLMRAHLEGAASALAAKLDEMSEDAEA